MPESVAKFNPGFEFLENPEIRKFFISFEDSFSEFPGSSPESRKNALTRAAGQWLSLYRRYDQEARKAGSENNLNLLARAVLNLQGIMSPGGMSMGRHPADIFISDAMNTMSHDWPQLFERTREERDRRYTEAITKDVPAQRNKKPGSGAPKKKLGKPKPTYRRRK